MKIAFFEQEAVDKNMVDEYLGSQFEVSFYNKKLDKNSARLVKDVEVVSVFVYSILDKETIDLMPNLKFVATRSTGFEHIDILYCRQKGIEVSYVPSYGDHTVAEMTFGLILNLSRNIFNINSYIKKTFNFGFNPLFRGLDLNNKTIGVVGTGKIGKNVIKIARSFNMNVVANDLYPDLDFAKANNVEYKNLKDIVKISDVISLHVPYTKENHHLINKEIISEMKRGILLINTARGSLIDTDALVWGLEQKIIGGAGLDVLENENDLRRGGGLGGFFRKVNRKLLSKNYSLIKMPNVIITPHVSFCSKEAEKEILMTTIKNIHAFASGSLINLVK